MEDHVIIIEPVERIDINLVETKSPSLLNVNIFNWIFHTFRVDFKVAPLVQELLCRQLLK